MKPIKLKTCQREGCNKKFKPYKTTDKHCSPACFYSDQKEKNNEKHPFEQTPIKRRSDKRASEERLYLKKIKPFLSKDANKHCPVMLHLEDKLVQTDQVHHKAGRIGKLLLHVPLWLAVSDAGHKWIHDNPEEAYELGFLVHSTTVRL